MHFFERIRAHRAGLVILLVLILIGISTITRIALLVKSSTEIDFTFLNLAGIFFLGWFYDLINALYFIIPLSIYLWLMPGKLFQRKWNHIVLYLLFFIFTSILIFNATAEWFFWDEFNVRFNFIAVDYLVYTTEVVGNIQQSYPMGWIIAAIVVLSATTVFGFRNWIASNKTELSFKIRSAYMACYVFVITAVFFLINNSIHYFSDNAFANELAGNGMYELFAAYRNNELDYDRFYARQQTEEAFNNLRSLIKTPEATFISADLHSIERKISNEGPEKKLNVVLISVESFSADFMKLFGNTQNLTPFLDSLANHSLVFTNLYATGTRTVRGLEALSICVPPTPGQSIVRRPHNEDLFSLGQIFDEKGYRSKYIYGGYGYFDNMNYFFENNGYEVVDRSSLKDEEIDYENIWGVADENLFDLALREIDKSSLQQPVFAHIMTTSNHRPFTYPDGRIDIPSHTNRQGAVKYTDYAIGQFIKEASKKKWFDQTIFVIVADHCASSAGKTELPVNRYHIPMLIYSPSNINTGTMDRLMSHIDVGPTLLGLLNFSYNSKFYGYDMFKLEAGRERAFISTYQNLGYLKGNNLIVLSPQQKIESFTINDQQELAKGKADQKLVNEAVAWYQGASYSYKNGLMKYRLNSYLLTGK